MNKSTIKPTGTEYTSPEVKEIKIFVKYQILNSSPTEFEMKDELE